MLFVKNPTSTSSFSDTQEFNFHILDIEYHRDQRTKALKEAVYHQKEIEKLEMKLHELASRVI